MKYILKEATNAPLKIINLPTEVKVVHLRDGSIRVLRRRI
tara:strand:- start:625 stop:744 length:120 start_codon:yes stop_codon:yes gene_type:complete